jgi:hypothetical protein
MSTESVSSDSSLQAAQLIEDQLSEEELEMVAGGVLNELHNPNRPSIPKGGGIGHIPIPKGPLPPGPLGNQPGSESEYGTFTSS